MFGRDTNDPSSGGPHGRFTNALNAFNEIGHDFCSKAHLEMFRGHVEAIEGGIRSFNLGGKRTNNKLSADRNYLRAAAIVLWKYHTQRKDNTAIEQLVLYWYKTKTCKNGF